MAHMRRLDTVISQIGEEGRKAERRDLGGRAHQLGAENVDQSDGRGRKEMEAQRGRSRTGKEGSSFDAGLRRHRAQPIFP